MNSYREVIWKLVRYTQSMGSRIFSLHYLLVLGIGKWGNILGSGWGSKANILIERVRHEFSNIEGLVTRWLGVFRFLVEVVLGLELRIKVAYLIDTSIPTTITFFLRVYQFLVASVRMLGCLIGRFKRGDPLTFGFECGI